jgi:hypothetical protein
MPRQSAAALAVLTPTATAVQLVPDRGAPAAVQEAFRQIVATAPAGAFKAGDRPLIQAYAEAIALSQTAAAAIAEHGPVIGKMVSPWVHMQEKAFRAMATLSTRLRLAPQHRDPSRAAGRRADGPRPSVYDLVAGDGPVD